MEICIGTIVVSKSIAEWNAVSPFLSELLEGTDYATGVCINLTCGCLRHHIGLFGYDTCCNLQYFLFDKASVSQVLPEDLVKTAKALLYLLAKDKKFIALQRYIEEQWQHLTMLGKAVAYTALKLTHRTRGAPDYVSRVLSLACPDELPDELLHASQLNLQEKLEFIKFYFADKPLLLDVKQWLPFLPPVNTAKLLHYALADCWAIGEYVTNLVFGVQQIAPLSVYVSETISITTLLKNLSCMANDGFYFGQNSPNTVIVAREHIIHQLHFTKTSCLVSIVNSLPVDAIQTVVTGRTIAATPRCLLAWLTRLCTGHDAQICLRLQGFGFAIANQQRELSQSEIDSAMTPRYLECINRSPFLIRHQFRRLLECEPKTLDQLRISTHCPSTDGCVVPWFQLNVSQYVTYFSVHPVPWSGGVLSVFPVIQAVHFELGLIRVNRTYDGHFHFVPTPVITTFLNEIAISYNCEASNEFSLVYSLSNFVDMQDGVCASLILRPFEISQNLLIWECVKFYCL
jgi:hypothetical protein